jgi:putative SOS response-associated peptidase YedK
VGNGTFKLAFIVLVHGYLRLIRLDSLRTLHSALRIPHVWPLNLRTPMTVLAEQFLFELGPLAKEAFRPRYNIAPTQLVAAVRAQSGPLAPRVASASSDSTRGASGPHWQRELALFHFGLIPSWAKDKKIAYSTINARGDTVADKPAFRSAFKSRRCLVLADGFYEWKKEGKLKLPFTLLAANH